MKTSNDYSAEEAIRRIEKMEIEKELLTFTAGEERKTVVAAAETRLAELRPKQGEQKGPITQETSDFKEGIQGAKNYVTCEDVIKKMREQGKKI
jgi:hypothetical protein